MGWKTLRVSDEVGIMDALFFRGICHRDRDGSTKNRDGCFFPVAVTDDICIYFRDGPRIRDGRRDPVARDGSVAYGSVASRDGSVRPVTDPSISHIGSEDCGKPSSH